MKLLSLTNGLHDTNMSYFDGERVHYYKPERDLQIKHFPQKQTNKDSIKILEKHLNEVHNTSFANFDKNQIIFNNKFKHHYAHALSVEAICDKKIDYNFVIDGHGGDVSWAVFKNENCIEKGTYSLCGSMGHGINYLAECLDIKDNILDNAGKLMGLQSYGNIDYDYLKIIQNYDMYSLGTIYNKISENDKLFSFKRWVEHKKDKVVAYNTRIDWAKTVHYRCGEIILNHFKKYAKPEDVVGYSGGCAQNIIWNTLLKQNFPNLVIYPHCGDEGISLGGIEFLRKLNNLPKFQSSDFPYMQSDEKPKTDISDSNVLKIAQLLATGKIVAWYNGFGEIGPRALGNRSILVDPRIKHSRDKINEIKKREFYRPFGASVLEEYKKEYFDLNYDNPYMLYVGKTLKPNLESITHVDGTCRAQTVNKDNKSFRKLLEEFYKLTTCPVLLNTSLNISGKPIAGRTRDAKEIFINNPIDVLSIGDEIYIKR